MYLSKNINQIKDEYKILTELKELYNLKEKYYSVQDIDYLLQRESILKRKLSSYMKLNYSFDEYNSLQVKLKIINATYLNNKSMNSTFNDVNGRSLDREQRISALSDEKSLLTIAGAGSGKTLTVCGKVKYLLDVEKIDPKDILILSYSKKSADDLESKIGSINDTIHVSTFHKLGLDIIKASMNIKPTVEEQFDAIIEEFFREELKHQPKICEILLKYLSLYSQPNTVKEYKNIGEMFEDLKSNDFTTLKDTLSATNDGKKKTFKKELVKSYEELSIANYLFLNGVDYEYEAPYKYDLSSLEKRQYLPDFHIKDTDIYLEHFGVNREFKCPQFSSSDEVEYLEGIKWKRYVHERYKTKLIETYSFNFNEGTIFDDLKTKLEESGIEFKPRSEEETFEILNSIYSGTDYKSFIKLLKSFISLYKARYEDINGFDIIMKKKFANRYEYDRTYMFIFIARNVYTFYKNKVASNHKIDFDDMILKSTNLLEEIDGYKFKYIFVDEFQDISFSRLKLLQVLIKKGNSKLYVVGDDWQAIYRFSGCDVNIFLNFKDYFEYSNQCLIPSTHRNSQELQNIAEAFITSNPNQLPKNINSNKSLKDPIRIVYYNDNKEQMLNFALGDIYKMNPNANVLLLGRNNYDIK